MSAAQSRRIVAGLPFVEALARRMASTMPHSIDVGDLVQDGVIGLIDAAHRFDGRAASSSRRLPNVEFVAR
jgi:DNA-directed RNA polymerase specialized sigma subunit